MRIKRKICAFFFTLLFLLPALSFGADAPKNAKYDKYGKPIGGTSTSIHPPLTGTGPQAVAEGNRLSPASVSVDPLPCRDFQYRGDVVLPAHRGEDYICDPGYECRGVVGGFQCGWRGLTQLASNNPLCKFDSCSEMRFRQALDDLSPH